MREGWEKRVISFIDRHPMVCFARIYASKAEQVEERVGMFRELVNIVNSLEYEGRKIIRQVVAIIPTNPGYKGRLDCGQTALTIRKIFPDPKQVHIIPVGHGGPFARALNVAMVEKIAQGIKHAFIFSTEARKSINVPTVLANIEAHNEGALYSGVAFDDLTARVKAGHIMNTWALLNIYEAMRVGGFHPFSELAVSEAQQYSMEAFDEKGQKYSYPVQGCEEGPLIHELYTVNDRPCTAVIDPIGEGIWKYVSADSDEERRRHQEKIVTKKKRLEALMHRCQMDPSYIWHAQMPEYRDERYNPEK